MKPDILQTERLILRELGFDDSEFILELVNDPGWLEFIGDKNIHTLDEARDYIRRGPMQMVERLGFGLYLVARRADRLPIGICGLIKRDSLPDVDVGFAFLPEHRSQGFAREATAAVLEHGRGAFGLRRIVAISSPRNQPCARLLASLGFTLEGMITPPERGEALCLFARDT